MCRKLITYLLLFSFLNYIGCSSTIYVTVEEYDLKVLEKDSPYKIFVKTNDSKKYHFRIGGYHYIRNDTLFYGTSSPEYYIERGRKVETGNMKIIQNNVPLEELRSIEDIGPDTIKVITNRGKEFQFVNKGYYYVINDTLYGKGKILLPEGEKNFTGKIAVSDISHIHSPRLIDGNITNYDFDIVKDEPNIGAELTILLKNGTELEGELLAVRDTTIIICTEHEASEAELAALAYPIITIPFSEINEITFEGASYTLLGLSLGTLTGIAAGLLAAEVSEPKGDLAGLAYVFGFALGFLAGAIIGTIVGNSLSVDDIALVDIPEGYDFSAWKSLARYPDDVPDFLKKSY